ncbi:MAG: nucleotidyltransferase domain-containing protein [Nanoarchaeota archaeon]|nr:nucleotidyltransferase domain-containing protein [Nanoarchaeota archaeon]
MDYSNINKNVIKIIEVLVDGRAYLNEIYEKTGIKSKNNLLKNLNILTNNKILIKEENKSNTFYSLNYKNNVSAALLNLINKIRFENLPFDIKKGISEALFNSRPRIAILFGSYAKKTYNKKSDIDLIFFDVIEKQGIKEISSKYGIKLNITFMRLDELQKDNEALNHIIKTGYPLVGAEYFYNEAKKI